MFLTSFIIYLSIIRPVLEYADIVWDNYTLHESNLLESVQVDAGRIITVLRINSSKTKYDFSTYNYSGNPDPGDSAFPHLSPCCLDFQNIHYGNQHYFFL
jgi:hypothetical protein